MLHETLNICNKIQSQDLSLCQDISSPIEVLIQSNINKLESFSHIINRNTHNKVKRSLEFGGEILKFFFGTLDADDARKYDAAIESCRKSETELFHLMKDNIHIIKSTINNFNSTIYKLNQNELKLNSQINNMSGILSQITKTDNLLLYMSKVNNLLNIIEGSLLAISNLMDTTLNAILFSKVNILHPSVISPLNLYNELSKHSGQINKRLDFPVQLNIHNINSLIDVSKLNTYFYNSKIVFILQIPLIIPDKFTVYKNIPLPTPHDEVHINTFALIQPSSQYIAMSDDRLHYAMLNDLKDCNILNNNYTICESCTVYSCISNPNCESKLLTEVTFTLPSECNAKLLYGQIDIWQKLRNNKWIYVQSNVNKLTIKCNDNINDYPISGTGIVKLTENCIGYSKTIQLIPSSLYSFKINSPLDISFDITADNCCKKEVFNKTLPQLTPISLSKINLDSLKYATRQLDNLESEINKAQNESHFIKYGPYYSTFTYILIVSLILYLSYRIYHYFKNKNSSNGTGCCVQIFNHCYNNSKTKSKMSNSVEMTEMSSSSEEDKKSIKSYQNCTTTAVIHKSKFPSSRNLNH